MRRVHGDRAFVLPFTLYSDGLVLPNSVAYSAHPLRLRLDCLDPDNPVWHYIGAIPQVFTDLGPLAADQATAARREVLQRAIYTALRDVFDASIDGVEVVGVSKGADRRPGDETLVLTRDEHIVGTRQLTSDSAALLLIQQIRDEAHRFAITGHRGRRAKQRNISSLEEIKGLGPKRRKLLLTHFGGLQRLQKAGREDIRNVPGFSDELAGRVYDQLHPNRVIDG